MKSVLFLSMCVCLNISFVSASVEFTDILNLTEIIADYLYPTPTLPELAQDTCWGPNNCTDDDESIRPFTVSFSDDMIEDLRFRIAHRKNFTIGLNGTTNTYGINEDLLDTFVERWANEYNFTAAAERLNQYPQYKTKIQGLDIHYIHVKPNTTKTVLPLLLLHGFPLTAYEYIYTIPYLQNQNQTFEFELIIPSIPGHGFSQGTNIKGLSAYQAGIIFKNLMTRLGHSQFYIHGYDMGHFVGSYMTVIYQDDILGFHTSQAFSFVPRTLAKYVVASFNTSAVVEPQYASRMYPLSQILIFFLENFGYLHMQATRPDTLAKGLQDSPSGLASWMLGLLIATRQGGNDNLEVEDGNIFTGYNVDDLLDAITIYWSQQNIATVIRMYAEIAAVYQDPVNAIVIFAPSKVPFAATKFLYEIIYQPDSFLMDKWPNLVYSNTLDFGGHCATLENPAVLSADIWTAVANMVEFNSSS